jgi:hypothetical protein
VDVEVDGAHGASVRKRLASRVMNRFEDAIARELSTRIRARTRSVRALVADGVALVTGRLGDGDPDALAAQVMRELPTRFGRHWDSGPAH